MRSILKESTVGMLLMVVLFAGVVTPAEAQTPAALAAQLAALQSRVSVLEQKMSALPRQLLSSQDEFGYTMVSATVTAITTGVRPIVSGTAGSGITSVSLLLDNGEDVYSSGPVAVSGGVWSHQVNRDLEPGSYTAKVYVGANGVGKSKNFSVNFTSGAAGGNDSFWSVSSANQIYGVGVYEAAFIPKWFQLPEPLKSQWKFGDIIEGTQTLSVPANSGLADNTLLVLSAYRQTKWEFKGDLTDLSKITRVYVIGYEDQRVVGLPANIPVRIETYKQQRRSGTRAPHVSYMGYRNKDNDFKSFEAFLESKTGQRFGKVQLGYSIRKFVPNPRNPRKITSEIIPVLIRN